MDPRRPIFPPMAQSRKDLRRAVPDFNLTLRDKPRAREDATMKRFVLASLLLPGLTPGHAGAVDGHTIFVGPEIVIVDTVADDFPRFDVAALCGAAWPGPRRTAEAAQTVCIARQNRLAALASRKWNAAPTAARANCAKRAERAGVGAYNVLYACVNAAAFTLSTRNAVNRVTSMIRAQNGLPRVDAQAVGSIQ